MLIAFKINDTVIRHYFLKGHKHFNTKNMQKWLSFKYGGCNLFHLFVLYNILIVCVTKIQ